MQTVNNEPMKIRLLPHIFKYIGFAIAATVIASIILALCGVIPISFVKIYLLPATAAGLLIAAISKDKQEDEMLMALRLRAFFAAFMFGMTYPITMFLLSSPNDSPQFDVPRSVITALIFYHGIFWWMKRRARK